MKKITFLLLVPLCLVAASVQAQTDSQSVLGRFWDKFVFPETTASLAQISCLNNPLPIARVKVNNRQYFEGYVGEPVVFDSGDSSDNGSIASRNWRFWPTTMLQAGVTDTTFAFGTRVQETRIYNQIGTYPFVFSVTDNCNSRASTGVYYVNIITRPPPITNDIFVEVQTGTDVLGHPVYTELPKDSQGNYLTTAGTKIRFWFNGTAPSNVRFFSWRLVFGDDFAIGWGPGTFFWTVNRTGSIRLRMIDINNVTVAEYNKSIVVNP